MPAALQADEFGDIFQVLAEDVLFPLRQHRYGAGAKFEQLLLSRRIVQYINRGEVNAFFRKKLFRSQATASTGLGEQDEFVTDAFHGRIVE